MFVVNVIFPAFVITVSSMYDLTVESIKLIIIFILTAPPTPVRAADNRAFSLSTTDDEDILILLFVFIFISFKPASTVFS